ncbi:DNA-binding transcriptional ArsR family regulator [Tamaricihabitans halophyticus]|uniref:DNA-binding transcriptional ArsR family regulator n=1 Tax=Tamaricihabitans halophyticus TaxID=1262583 RepID=A0A4R2QVC5_9PSEU|nr:DUF5937 family protein [Tamaricihabitans halophyticus]TCP50991.1 DNA-binding transcriptional ArsR family regulator [Tamaricihabitans halophyticus]
MLELRFTVEDIAHTRFALSPLWETIASVRVLQAPSQHSVNQPWAAAVGPRLRAAGLDWTLLSALVPVSGPVIPGFICPPPSSPVPDIDIELATVGGTELDRVRAELDELPVRAHVDKLAFLREDPRAGLALLTETIARYWTIAVRPYWPRMRTLLESEVHRRAHSLATSGIQGLLNDLNAAVGWDDDVLSVAHRHVSGSRSLNGRGLLLVPSVFSWPRVFSIAEAGVQPTLRYPPRGIATLWESDKVVVPDGLAAVLGGSRARLLAELDKPVATRELAERVGLTAGAVSQHLGALRQAGLIHGYRAGRRVFYSRTDAAEALLAAAS